MTSSYYNDVPYVSDPLAAAHPDRLATAAVLFGMQPEPTNCDAARILEIGCGSGPTTIPIALSLPGAEIVGIDVSEYQINKLQERISELQISNLSASRVDLVDFPADAGQFDYIIAHGLYTWFGPEVQDALMHVCKRHLAPNGVAMVSYNTKPGWDLHGPVRDFMLYHTRDQKDPFRKAAAARELANWAVESLPNVLRSRRDLFVALEDSVQNKVSSDSYLTHDLLAPEMKPVLFADFAAHAARHGLRYLAEVDVHKMRDPRIDGAAYDQVEAWTDNLVERQQYLDFLVGRRFRRSLLCHADTVSDTEIRSDRLRRTHVATAIKCQHPTRRLGTDESIEFETTDKIKGTTRHPLTKTAWLILSESWPVAVQFEKLVQLATRRLKAMDPTAPPVTDRDRLELETSLTQMVQLGTLQARLNPPQICGQPTVRPMATQLARWQAAQGVDVTNLMMRSVAIDPLQAALLPLVDGTRDRDALLADWHARVTADRIHLSDVQQVPSSSALHQRLDADLDAFARAGLLCG